MTSINNFADILIQLSSVNGGDGVTKTLELELQPVSGPGDDHDHDVPGFLKLTEGGSLNLSCEVADMDRKDKEGVTLSWYLPNHFVEKKR